MLGALFPSEPFERTNRFVAWLNGAGVVALLLVSVLVLGSLCLLCSGYYLFSLASLWLFQRYRPRRAAGEAPSAGRARGAAPRGVRGRGAPRRVGLRGVARRAA
ncbi:MAG: hypothetical protein R6X22_12210 [Gemmatimonadota bacterium]